MQDPLPENIEGSKQVVHSIEHRINWGYVALGVGAIVVAVKVAAILGSSTSDEVGEVGSTGEAFEIEV